MHVCRCSSLLTVRTVLRMPKRKAATEIVKTEDVPVQREVVVKASIKRSRSKRSVKKISDSVEISRATKTEASLSLNTFQSTEKSLRSLKFVGAHTSIAGGPATAVREALEIGAKAFALFVRSARTWTCPPLTDEAVENFKETLKQSGIHPSKIVVHGSYLINAGAPDDAILAKSRAGMLDEVQRCEKLGIPYYNFHPGSTCGKISIDECCNRIAETVTEVLSKTKDVTILLENMSGQGSTIGGDLEELAQIIRAIPEEHQSRIGVCLDTCHSFAAGNDISSAEGWNKFINNVDRIIGWSRVKAFHLNDSKFACGANKDRHEHIGKGFIGIEGFRCLMNDPRTNHLPMVLETEGSTFKEEIALLYSLCVE